MERLPVKERVVNDVVAGRLVMGAKRVGCAEFAGLNGVARSAWSYTRRKP
jgi:hypothetical protein